MEEYIKQLAGTNLARLNDRDRMIIGNYRLAADCTKDFLGKGLEDADVFASAMEGLVMAVDHYDASAGTDFAPYACRWIRGAICRALTEEGHLIRLPKRVRQEVEADRELAEWLLPVISPAADLARIVVEEDSEQITLADTICDTDAAEQLALREEVEEHLANVSPQQREVLVRHYLHGEEMRDIGRSMHVTAARVRQIKQGGITQMIVAKGKLISSGAR